MDSDYERFFNEHMKLTKLDIIDKLYHTEAERDELGRARHNTVESPGTSANIASTPLQAPSAHSLVKCLRELKYGRPAREQLVVDELVNFTTARLGSEGPGWPPEVDTFDQ